MINKRNPKREEILKFRRKIILLLFVISHSTQFVVPQNKKQIPERHSVQSSVSTPLENLIPIIKPSEPAIDPGRLKALAAVTDHQIQKTKEKPLNLLFSKKLGILKMKSFGKPGGHPNLISSKPISQSAEKARTKKKMLSKVSDSPNSDSEDQDRFETDPNPSQRKKLRGVLPDHLRPQEIKDDRLKKLQAIQAEKEARRLKILKMQEQMKRSRLMSKAALISDEAILKLINRHEISNDLFDDGSKEFKEKTKNTLRNKYTKGPKNSVESEKDFLDQIKTLDRKIKRLKKKIQDIHFSPIDKKKFEKELKILVDEQSKYFLQ